MVITIGEIIQELLKAHQDNRDVDLNKLKTRISSKYGLDRSPRLVDIIAAVPADARNILVPKLKAKPIRTASGVCFYIIKLYKNLAINKIDNNNCFFTDSSSSRYVQTTQMSPYQYDGKHLRILSRRSRF